MQVSGSQTDTLKLIENSFKGDECFWKFKTCQTASAKKKKTFKTDGQYKYYNV